MRRQPDTSSQTSWFDSRPVSLPVEEDHRTKTFPARRRGRQAALTASIAAHELSSFRTRDEDHLRGKFHVALRKEFAHSVLYFRSDLGLLIEGKTPQLRPQRV